MPIQHSPDCTWEACKKNRNGEQHITNSKITKGIVSGRFKMKILTRKRASKRCACNINIEFSRFNSGTWFDALSVNHSENGMCIKSNTSFKPGTPLLIRIKNYPSKISCPCACTGLPTITLGEIQWCSEMSDSFFSSSQIGVKYNLSGY